MFELRVSVEYVVARLCELDHCCRYYLLGTIELQVGQEQSHTESLALFRMRPKKNVAECPAFCLFQPTARKRAKQKAV